MAIVALNIICTAQIIHHISRWIPLTKELYDEYRQKRMVHHLDWNKRQHRSRV